MDKKQVTFISGTRKGIGKELALYYLNLGHEVVGCSRKESSIDHPAYRHFQVDIAIEADVVAMFSTIQKEIGFLSNLINNAGISAMNHSLITPASQIMNIFSTNFLGSFLLSREAARLMKKNHAGRIVNFTTVLVPQNKEGHLAYVSSKAAVESMTQILAKELAHLGITVNAIGPNSIQTDLIAGLSEKMVRNNIDEQAIKRVGQIKDITNVIDFYLREESSFITGQVLYLGGVS